ncbi:hypothetical protein C2G38_2189611 [Gigaspora rosea]|uniref:BTB/POZ domain-containing protein n=1 Tax=Gigaspora rosea TaxID=44941 RepID=A0A397V2A3_9GLOM|nr:hypothetical protein C2G38_2189611 [Gigaspora rosea]
MDTKLLQQFTNDFEQLLESEYNYDVIVKIDEQSFKLHSLVLYQRSSFFREKLSRGIKKNSDNIIEITVPRISPNNFKILIKYIYTGTITIKDVEPSTIFDLLISFNELDFEELVNYIQSNLMNDKAPWLRFKFFKVYESCFLYDDFEALQTFYIDILAEYPNLIFDANEFNMVEESDLVTLLKRDDLQLEESKIWDKIIQWGKENTQNLPFNITQWTNENFLALKTTLNNCIPLIRYFQMSGKDLVTKVKPYKQILGPNLWEDITTSEISSWIDRNSSTYDIRCIPYEFKLLLRGSKDGFDFESFDALCVDIPGTVIVMKVNKTNEILGGYNPLVWPSDNDECLETPDSFIFSLKSQNLPTSILSRIRNANIAVGYDSRNSYSRQGPYFADSFFYVGNKKWNYSYENDHEKQLRDDEEYGDVFFVDEIEVFQVLKKQMKV